MNDNLSVSEMAATIRNKYMADPSSGQQTIDAYVKEVLAERPPEEARAIIEEVMQSFSADSEPIELLADKELLTRVFGLLLGRKVTLDDLTSGELLERLAKSLNTIFNALNELISVINMTFAGGEGTGEQTIRQFIGFHLEGEDQTQSLEAYLGKINDAFLTTQKASKAAVQTKVGQILNALDPSKLAAERSGGLKIGPMRKAEDFDILKEKIERIRRWYDSGRFMEEYSREFEKSCQKFNQV